jgi:hypothetical protein
MTLMVSPGQLAKIQGGLFWQLEEFRRIRAFESQFPRFRKISGSRQVRAIFGNRTDRTNPFISSSTQKTAALPTERDGQ